MSNSVSGDPDMDNKLTDLVVAARRAFAPQQIDSEEKQIRYDELAALMDTFAMHDIGCCEKDPRMKIDPVSSKLHVKSPLKAISIYNDLDLEIKAIFIPPNSRIPMHDHPGMTVFQKVLVGNMRYQDGDLDDDETMIVGHHEMRKIHAKSDQLVDCHTPTLVVLPDDGNLHEIQEYGGMGCCFLDIMSPPYDITEGRNLSFFEPSIMGYAKKIDAYNNADFCTQIESHPDNCDWVNEHKVAAALDD